MKRFIIRFIFSCILFFQVDATPPIADLVSIVAINFLNGYRGAISPNYNLTGDIETDINKLASEIDDLSYNLQTEILRSRLIPVTKLYMKQLSQCADFIHRQHAILFDPTHRITQEFTAENIAYIGMLDKQMNNCGNKIKSYLKAAADIIKNKRPDCDTRSAKQLIWNEILDAAFVILKGYQLKQISLIVVDNNNNNNLIGRSTSPIMRMWNHTLREGDVEEKMLTNFEKIKVSLQEVAKHGLSQLRRFNAAWGCNLTETKRAVYLKQYGKNEANKKICLKPFTVEFNYEVVTVVKFVEVDNVFYLKPLIANFVSYVNKILEYPHLAWNFSNVSPNCEELYLYDVQENSSIILGDVYVPGQVVTGFQLKVREGKFGPELYLVVVSRIMDENLRNNLTMYEERYKDELLKQREATVIEASPAICPGQPVFYYSYLKPNLSAQRIESRIPPSLSKSELKLVNVQLGTHIVFKNSDPHEDGSTKLLPPIDTQMIVRTPQWPFSGAGFMLLRGDENTSGYLALKLLHGDSKDDIDNLLFTRMVTKNVSELHEWMHYQIHNNNQ